MEISSIIANVSIGLSTALSLTNLFYCFLGVFLGMLIGVVPGIGALVAVSLLLPVTFHIDATAALIMLAGIYYGSAYGGSTAAILLNVPGTPSSAVACLDGYPMAQQGRAGVALLMTTVGSFIAGSIGILLMMFFSPILVAYALKFGPTEYFSLMVLGLVAASTIASGSPVKGVAMVVLGVALGLVGTDIYTATLRYDFGFPGLYDGISLVAIAMALFGVTEVVFSVRSVGEARFKGQNIRMRDMIPTRDDVRRSVFPILRGSAIGSFFGVLPGTGGLIASFMAYAVEKRVSKTPQRFGHGAIEGVVSPESANNAADQTAFIPTMTLGIPGSVVMAIMLSVLIVHGLVPGPKLMVEHADLFWGLVMSFWIGNLILLVLNIPLIGLWVKVLAVPYHLLYPAIIMFVCIGVYSVHNSAFDVWLVLVFSVAGYFMRVLEFPAAPLLLGLVLGPIMEEEFRRAMILSHGDLSTFVHHPISGTILAMTLALLMWAIWSGFRRSLQRRATEVTAS
ncbi:MAG: tripartite tricarboxylate transporter permease [Rhizobiales bacterium]|nr:tripartite tricarboxylate transporter permease [Hyphomicrobiales bacterium]